MIPNDQHVNQQNINMLIIGDHPKYDFTKNLWQAYWNRDPFWDFLATHI